jgi:hypothetical protein
LGNKAKTWIRLRLGQALLVIIFAGWNLANGRIVALVEWPDIAEGAIYPVGLAVIVAGCAAWAYSGNRRVRARLAELESTRPTELHYPVILDPLWMPVGTTSSEVSRPQQRLGYLHVGELGLSFTVRDGTSVLRVPWDELIEITYSIARGPIFEIVVSDSLTWSRWWFELHGRQMPGAAGARRTRALVARIEAARPEPYRFSTT